MPIDPYYQKGLLDWLLGGATPPAQPTAWFVNLATSSPTTSLAYEGQFGSRGTIYFRTAHTAGASASASNGSVASVTFISVGANSATALGWNLWDNTTAGHRIAYGTLTSSAGVRSSGSTIGFAIGALVVTLQ